MVTDLHAKNQVNIFKRLEKRSGKLILRTNRRTECKPKVPFGFLVGTKNRFRGKKK